MGPWPGREEKGTVPLSSGKGLSSRSKRNENRSDSTRSNSGNCDEMGMLGVKSGGKTSSTERCPLMLDP